MDQNKSHDLPPNYKEAKIKMLSKEGFVYHVSQIQHETEMYNTYKSPISVESIERSKLILIKYFEEQELLIQKLHKEIKGLNQEIGGYSGSIQAITEEFNFLLGRLALVSTKMMDGEK